MDITTHASATVDGLRVTCTSRQFSLALAELLLGASLTRVGSDYDAVQFRP